MFRISRSSCPCVSTGRAEPTTGSFRSRSIAADLKLITSMKNVISWNTMSRIGVRFGSALAAVRHRGGHGDRVSSALTGAVSGESAESDYARLPPGRAGAAAAGFCFACWTRRRTSSSAASSVSTEILATRFLNTAKKINRRHAQRDAFERQHERFGNAFGHFAGLELRVGEGDDREAARSCL